MEKAGTALVTGAARRIGAAIVESLAEAGFDVAIHCRHSRSEAEAMAARLSRDGRKVVVVAGDLSRSEAPQQVITEACARLGALTLLVNNASLFERDEVSSLTPASFDSHVAVNLRAPLLLARFFAAQVPAGAHAAIVNILDQRVTKPTPDFFSYTLTKIALHAATTTLAQALAPHIRVNAVSPGPTLASARQSPEIFTRQCRAMPLERGATPKEIAEAVLFLAQARAITGTTIAVDGGQHIEWRTIDGAGIVE